MFVDGIDEKCVDQNKSAHGNVQNREGIQKKRYFRSPPKHKKKIELHCKIAINKKSSSPPPDIYLCVPNVSGYK